MKTKITTIFLLGIVLTTSACSYQKSNGEGKTILNGISLGSNEGKGEIIDKTYDYNFDNIQVSNSLNVEIIKSSTEKITVSAPSDIMNDIAIIKDGDVVKIKVADGVRNISTNRVKVKVYANDFSKLSASSSSSVRVTDAFKNNNFDIKASSSASIKGNFDAKTVNLQVTSSSDFAGEIFAQDANLQTSSSGTISVKGRSENLNAQASSSADIDGAEFTTEAAVLQASSSGGIKVGVRQSATGSASSSGDIVILKKGNLSNISVKENSSGTVVVK